MDSTNEPQKSWHLQVAGITSVLVVIAFYLAGMFHFTTEEWDKFGGFVSGGAGVILTSLSFLALLYTIHIQSRELSLSRQELSLTRQEMQLNRGEVAKSAEALSEQVRAVAVQNFERTLFESLGFLSAMVEQFEFKSPWEDKIRKGVQSFYAMYARLGHHHVNLGGLGDLSADEIGNDENLNSVFDELRLMLAPYFRTLYNIYRFLDESEFREVEYYNRIIRSQLPDHALVILFYNSLTPRGRKFQRYLVRYSILDNMPNSLLFNPHHSNLIEQFPTPLAQELLGGEG
jgi:hypothetical protein